MGETARGLLERVTSALGRLSIQVSLNVSGNQSHGSVVIGGASEVGEPASPQDFTSATSSPREPAGGQSPQPAASTTTTPAELPWYQHLTPVQPVAEVLELVHLIGGASQAQRLDRIQVAYQRGRQAAEIIRGEGAYFRARRCSLPNTVYVILRTGVEAEQPFYTRSLALHQRKCKTGLGGRFHPQAVSHGFPTVAEATAFCFGAGLNGLPEEQ